jgi:hypothetical protein
MAAPLFARAALRRGLPSLAPGAVGGVRSVTSKLFLAGELTILATCLSNWIRIELFGKYDPHKTAAVILLWSVAGLPDETTEHDVKDFFSEYGNVVYGKRLTTGVSICLVCVD